MGEVVPGVSVVAVVFPHRSPLPLAQVRAPFLPGDVLVVFFLQSDHLWNVSPLLHGRTSFLRPMSLVSYERTARLDPRPEAAIRAAHQRAFRERSLDGANHPACGSAGPQRVRASFLSRTPAMCARSRSSPEQTFSAPPAAPFLPPAQRDRPLSPPLARAGKPRARPAWSSPASATLRPLGPLCYGV